MKIRHFSKLVLAMGASYTLSVGSAYGITLEEATYKAIEASPTVRQSIAKYREGQANAEISFRSGWLPKIDLSAGYGHETTYDYNDTGNDVELMRRELSVSLEQPIFDGFMSVNDTQRLRDESEADRWEALIAVENTALEVAEAYANVLRHRELVDLADINLQTHKRIYEQIKLKSDSGVGRQSDLSQITARVAKAQANWYSAVNNLQDADSVYKKLVGELPPADMIYPVPDRKLIPASLDDAIASAMKKNPAIEGAKWDTRATESFKKATDSNKYPSINFVLERSFNNNLDGNEGPSEDLIAMVRLNYNIYKGNTDKRRYEVAVQQNIQASEIQRNTTRETELTVRLAWASYEASLASKEYLREYVIATKESQVAYENQFRLGRRTLLDVLDSENELFQARQDYVNADYDELFSEFRLFNAKGELMRAFRIYRPPLLGFADEFEQDMLVQEPLIDSLEGLKAAETEVPGVPVVVEQPTIPVEPVAPVTAPTPDPVTTEKADEVLFLDATEAGSAW